MHVHCLIHAAWSKPCCVSMSMLHVHVHTTCPCQCSMSMSISIIEMPECRTVRHLVSPVPDWKKLTMLEQVRYRTKLTQSGIFLVRYWTKIRDAGMLMPALVSSMPMPSYASILPQPIQDPDRIRIRITCGSGSDPGPVQALMDP